jgi:hypothetical protein
METPKGKDGKLAKSDIKPADSVEPRRKEPGKLDPGLFRRIFEVSDVIIPSVVATLPPPAFENPTATVKPKRVDLPSAVRTLPPPAPGLIRSTTALKVHSAVDVEIDLLRAEGMKFDFEILNHEDEPDTADMIQAALDFDRLIKILNIPIPFKIASTIMAYLFNYPSTGGIKSFNDLFEYFKAGGVRKLFKDGKDFVEFLGKTYSLKKRLVSRNLVIPEISEAFLLTIKAINKSFEDKA